MNVKLLTGKDFFDVVSAIRGPDRLDGSIEVKNMTTAVIRYFAGIPTGRLGAVVCSPREAKAMWELLTPESQQAVKDYLNHPLNWHFARHVKKAFQVFAERSRTARAYVEFLQKENILYV